MAVGNEVARLQLNAEQWLVAAIEYDQAACDPREMTDLFELDLWSSQRDCDRWLDEDGSLQELTKGQFYVGKYEHGQVQYFLADQRPEFADRWDTTPICGVLTLCHIEGMSDDDLKGSAKSTLEEFTSWCNGDCWEYVVAIVDEDDNEIEWLDSCGSIIGQEWAESEAVASFNWQASQQPVQLTLAVVA